ncbi:signal peptidase I [Neisseria weaveri]|uniref:Signal peptidase I n=1 Tax=Neisseria weaveri TaxID=28091 RepID=A0A3S4Z6D4_9NEIS|nr:signal peptidase I [Neisseria weaveri]EGV35199.1 signal peptidase I [Neisseria weaveri ATCC 51223]EGV36948.1 signal peptidase I [Neisseria weaveri LMG 5135]SAY51045.1 signal peptidase I [Neisseria weaveri]VEJ49549.1 signal peptidase I [Neisseria weaveri]
MGNTLTWGAVAVFIAGLVLFFRSSKQREENGEWHGGLQWGYLLMMVGVFGMLSVFMSFTAVLLIFVLFTGIVWFIHKGRLKKNGSHDDNHFTDYMSGFFPIILIVFVVRTFIAEPFQIPSSSMRPGLVVGDFILVNKFSYGIRTPVINNVLVPTGTVERGDVVVFNYPEDEKINYIKRAVGVPGDVVEYNDKVLRINGEAVGEHPVGMYGYQENTRQYGMVNIEAEAFEEKLGGRVFQVLKMPNQPAFLPQGVRSDFAFRGNCTYAEDGSAFKCTVPEGHYFMMGDNRDNSEDSRYWGFVSDRLIVGKAFFVWMNFGDFSRIGTKIQ